MYRDMNSNHMYLNSDEPTETDGIGSYFFSSLLTLIIVGHLAILLVEMSDTRERFGICTSASYAHDVTNEAVCNSVISPLHLEETENVASR